MSIEIRKIRDSDMPQILELAREVREHHREFLDGYFAPQDDNKEREIILLWVNNPQNICLLAEENEKILGMILGEFRQKPEREKSQIIIIHNFGVFKEIRGQGIGKMLMNEFYKECKIRGIEEIKLGVFNKNKTAYEFYERYGFEPLEQKMSLMIK